MDKQFEQFIHDFIQQYKTDIFNHIQKCKSLLLDHAKKKKKKEIRLLLQAIDLGGHTARLSSNDLNLTRISLIKQLQGEYFISEEISASVIDLILLEFRNFKYSKPVPPNNQLNITNQNQSNTINLNNNAIHELSSLISSEKDLLESRLNLLYEKHKTIYEPAVTEYRLMMRSNKLECEYYVANIDYVKGQNGYSNGYINSYIDLITYKFKFIDPFSPPSYTIRFIKDDFKIITTCQLWKLFPSDCNKAYPPPKYYQTEELTKEIIINNLSEITKII
jgi:hypothetical protein